MLDFATVIEDERDVAGCRWDNTKRKKILVVDDINDTGATFNWIMEDWDVSHDYPDEKTNVRFAVLMDNLASDCKVNMSYIGTEINKAEDPSWIVFPWEEWW